MKKIIFTLAISLIVGCSSSGKKQAADTQPVTPSGTPAVNQAPAQSAPISTEASKSSKSKEASAPSTATEVTCTSGQDVRKLSIKSKEQGCELDYTKAGQASSIASQIIGKEKCEEVSTRIQEKLIAANFKCE
ncbi:MAG: hypothetical protein JNL11_00685 [Bdellovibrionaceae bacterium]|nr:hypothetical protein [Pseudobdellovibrionaceae bacterium]